MRQAVDHFIRNYNQSWRMEQLGYLSPTEYREQNLTKLAA
ncbi:MAG: IS3 family transposase [Deltaproteobacteria bacterium]|nr:IS3 family transposase [Deltaproteobacteria bacterium]